MWGYFCSASATVLYYSILRQAGRSYAVGFKLAMSGGLRSSVSLWCDATGMSEGKLAGSLPDIEAGIESAYVCSRVIFPSLGSVHLVPLLYSAVFCRGPALQVALRNCCRAQVKQEYHYSIASPLAHANHLPALHRYTICFSLKDLESLHVQAVSFQDIDPSCTLIPCQHFEMLDPHLEEGVLGLESHQSSALGELPDCMYHHAAYCYPSLTVTCMHSISPR